MLEKVKEIKENKKLRIVSNIAYIIIFIIVVMLLIVVALQRITNNNVALGGYRIFSVATGSMIPVYEVGDILVSEEIQAEDIKVGDDIVYKGEKGSFKDKVITHRVISSEKQEDGNYKIITRGVANNEQDPEINQTQVYGKIIYKIKILSFIGRIVKNIYVFYFIIFIPIGVIIYQIIRNLVSRDDDEEEDDKKENNGEDSKNN